MANLVLYGRIEITGHFSWILCVCVWGGGYIPILHPIVNENHYRKSITIHVQILEKEVYKTNTFQCNAVEIYKDMFNIIYNEYVTTVFLFCFFFKGYQNVHTI